MSSKTKIFVFRTKELIYTGIFLLLGIVLLVLLVSMFTPDDSVSDPAPKTTQEVQFSAPLALSPGIRAETSFKIQTQLLHTAEADRRLNMAVHRILL